jgi:pimeloyl-ACP methyl ester carboxylesterase
VDGSGWQGVYNILKKDGYKVSIVQNPTISLGDDVAVTKRVLAAQPGPVLLVGHSYGGVVITEAGTDPKVAGLVYIAAFAPDKESVSALTGIRCPARQCRRSRRRGWFSLTTPFSFIRCRRGRGDGNHGGPAVPRGVGRSAISANFGVEVEAGWYLVATDDR